MFFVSCCFANSNDNDSKKSTKDYSLKTDQIVNLKDRLLIYENFKDSVQLWSSHKLGLYTFDKVNFDYYVDSLLCFNKNGDRFVGCIIQYTLIKNAPSDGLIFGYGEKIEGAWYFFRGAAIVIPRSMVKGHPINQPLSYAQLHQIALKEVYGGYLKSDGSMNEAWFTSHFEDIGWGDFNDQTSSLKYLGLKPNEKFTDKRKFFEAIHLQSVKNNWYQWWKQDSIKKSKENIN